MPFNIGGPELIIVLVIVLIVFGAGKLPNVMRDVGRGVKEFKRAQTEEEIEAEAKSRAVSEGRDTATPPTTVTSTGPMPNGQTTETHTRTGEPAPRA
jgi:sec-independent protein translocase protein TatA